MVEIHAIQSAQFTRALLGPGGFASRGFAAFRFKA